MNMKKKIGILDDDVVLVNVWSEFLSMKGYEPIVMSYGSDAFERVKTVQPDLMLVDILMPGMDGIQFSKNLKSSEEFKHIPIILISAIYPADKVKAFSRRVADDYLVKPFKVHELLSKIRKFLEEEDDDENYDTQEFEAPLVPPSEETEYDENFDTKGFTEPPLKKDKKKKGKKKKDGKESGRVTIAKVEVSYNGTSVEMKDVKEAMEKNPFEDEPAGE
jgi:DNA-binding response OmpR family regulator